MKVLFICRSNAERSQVAEVLFNFYSKKHRASSAGVNVANEKGEGGYPGRIMAELLLGMGRNEIQRKRKKQLTEQMARKADRIIVMLNRKRDIDELLPDYVKRSKKTVFWKLGYVPMSVYKSFPPYTYEYHAQWVLKIEQLVRELVDEVG